MIGWEKELPMILYHFAINVRSLPIIIKIAIMTHVIYSLFNVITAMISLKVVVRMIVWILLI
jgi:hypothetical protein